MMAQSRSDLHSLIYTSNAAPDVANSTYETIATTSHNHNEAVNITGILLVHNGLIMQILEGQEADVETLYARIERDDRHRNAEVLIRRSLKERDFPNWAMGYQCSDAFSVKNWVFKLSQASIRTAIPGSVSDVNRALLRSFSKASGLSYI